MVEKSLKILKNTDGDKTPIISKEIKIKSTILITQDVIEDCLSTCLG